METQNERQQTGNGTPGDAALNPPQNQLNESVNDNVQNPTVNQEKDSQPQQSQTPVVPESDEVRGLKAAAEAERKKRQDLEQQLVQAQMFMSQMARNSAPAGPQQAQQGQPQEFLSELSDSDLLDPAKVRLALKRTHDAALSAAQTEVNRVRFQMQFPDYESLVGRQDPITGQFRPSEIMQEALNEDPSLWNELTQSPNAPAMAYRTAKMQKRMREIREAQAREVAGRQQQQSAAAQQAAAAQASARNAQNTASALTAPMSPASVSGVTPQATQQDWSAALTDPQVANQLNALLDKIRSGST